MGKNNFYIFFAMFMILYCKTYSQYYPREPFNNYYQLRDSIYSYSRGRETLDADTNEGGYGAEFRRLESFWEPRLYPSGDFSLAIDAINNFNNTKTTTITANWSPLGPEENGLGGVGRIQSIAFDPSDPSNIIYAGSPFGGLWKTTDGGQNWVNLTDNKLPLIRVSDVAVDPQNSNTIYIATGDGNVISKSGDISDYGDVSGTTYTKYSGDNVPITCDYTGGHYILNDNARGITTTHYDAQNGWHSISSSNTYFDNSAVDEVGGDAHWGAEKTYDYFKNTFNWIGWDNDSAELIIQINDNSHSGGNSRWENGYIYLGDGTISVPQTMEWAGIDILGHEFTHGILQTLGYTGNAIGSQMFRESVCDIFGTMIKFYAKPNNADWIFGKDITTDGAGIRNIAEPHLTNMPDTYNGTFYNTEFHSQSVVYSHMIYLLSEGGSGTNNAPSPDGPNYYYVTGIGKENSAKLVFQAISYTIPSSYDVNSGTVEAAKEIFGDCSNELIQLYNAMYAVNYTDALPWNDIYPLFPYDSSIVDVCSLSFNGSGTSINHSYDILKVAGSYCNNSVIVPSDSTTIMTAGNKIILKNGFKATNGCSFHAYISPCAEGQSSTEKHINNEANNNKPDVKPLQKENNYCKIYPNPASNFINIEYVSGYDGNVCVELSDILGKKIRTKSFSIKKGSNLLMLPLNYNPELHGLYYISIRTERKFISNKIIIQ